ncbi:sesquipedalian-1-like [Dermatophagoides pteronyssinus]|uniref:sesquipedalian-1-like n=1 Tax=Dermatophagoides pteronyssinus TaxID=6956 RepID=UPI003F663378
MMKMKVNERCLIQIAQSDDQNPIDQCGWLQQWMDEKKLFQRKWFVLKENLLFYYNQRNDREPSGLIILDGYRVEIIECLDDDRFPFKIDFGISRVTGKPLKSFILAADNHTDMEQWIKALSCASYDYLKMVVSELEHRLGEIDQNEKTITTTTSTDNSNDDDHCKSISSPILSNDSKQQRFNPFDERLDDSGQEQQLTFADLHERYGQQIRKCFQ